MSLFQTIKDFFRKPETFDQNHDGLRIAKAVLLLETAAYDNEVDPRETAVLEEIIAKSYQLDAQEVADLLQEAHRHREARHDIFGFTNQLCEAMTMDQRQEVMTEIWQVILADGRLDPNEAQLARKLKALLRLDHAHWVSARKEAEEKAK